MAKFAISCGSANLFIGIEAAASTRSFLKLSPVDEVWSFIRDNNRSVATPPGQIVFIVTPVSAIERDADFDNAINGDEWVLVDFWAPWCGPCKALGPILEQVAAEMPVTIAKVNTDTDSMNAAKLGVRGIPALFLFHNGKLVANQTGMVPKPVLTNWLDQQMSAGDF